MRARSAPIYLRQMKVILYFLAVLVGFYLIGRGVAELFLLHWSAPASYARDWGGPSLAGVLAVRCGPGLVALALMIAALRRRPRQPQRSGPPGATPARLD